MDCKPARLLCPWYFPCKKTGVGCNFLLQGILLNQESNPRLLHLQVSSLPLSHQGSLLCMYGCSCSVAKSCLTLCNLMDCSMPRSCVFHCPQIHAHWVSDTNQPSYLLLPFSPFAFNLSQHQGLFQSQLFISGGPSIGVSATVLPIYTQGWFPLGLTGFIFLLSKAFSGIFSSTTIRKN